MAIIKKRSSGSGSIAIHKDSVVVWPTAKTLDFIGSGTNAVYVGSDKVAIYIPSLSFSPPFNSDSSAIPNLGTLRRISKPTAEGIPFNIDPDWSGDDLRTTINTNTPTWTTGGPFTIYDLTTTLDVTAYDSDNMNILASRDLTISGNSNTTINDITITITGFTADNYKYKASASVSLDLDSILAASGLSGGKFKIMIVHDDTIDPLYATTRTKQQTLFYDPDNLSATVSGVSISENSITGKYLSGLHYIDIGDTFDVAISDMDNLNFMSYPNSQQVTVDTSSFFGITNLSLQGRLGNLVGWASFYNTDNVSYSGVNLAVSVSDFRYVGTAAHITAQVHDWIAGASSDSPDTPYLIDTYGIESDELSEYFTDEFFRLESDFTTAWDSTQSLLTYDGNNGLLIQNGLLQVPHTDWSVYNPLPNPDYSVVPVQDWYYYRKIIDITSGNRSSATLNITGFDLDDLINSRVQIWINIPGIFTGPCYVHGADTFNAVLFNPDPQNKSLRLASSTSDTIYISFGIHGLLPAVNYFELTILINTVDAATQPSSLVVSW